MNYLKNVNSFFKPKGARGHLNNHTLITHDIILKWLDDVINKVGSCFKEDRGYPDDDPLAYYRI
jgi:hypothetical protein